jgi:hypothetical protein
VRDCKWIFFLKLQYMPWQPLPSLSKERERLGSYCQDFKKKEGDRERTRMDLSSYFQVSIP